MDGLYNIIVGDTDGSRLVFRSFTEEEAFDALEEIQDFFQRFKPEFAPGNRDNWRTGTVNIGSCGIFPCHEPELTEKEQSRADVRRDPALL